MRAASDRGRLVETAFEGSTGRRGSRRPTSATFGHADLLRQLSHHHSADDVGGLFRRYEPPAAELPWPQRPTSDRSRAGVPLTPRVSRGVPAARLRSRHELGNDSARARRDRAHSRDDDPETSRPPALESLALLRRGRPRDHLDPRRVRGHARRRDRERPDEAPDAPSHDTPSLFRRHVVPDWRLRGCAPLRLPHRPAWP